MQGETVPAKRFARLSSVLRASFGLVVDVALPQLCPTCREPVHGAGLCPACWSKLSFIAPPYCERLGIPFPFDGGPGLLSMEAIADPPAYHRARAAVRYDDIARKLVHAGNTATGSTSPRPWDAGWRVPAASSLPTPTPSFRCRCTGGGNGRDGSTNRRCWP